MYSLRDFGDMIADRERFKAYTRAITEAVRPGDTLPRNWVLVRAFSPCSACHAGGHEGCMRSILKRSCISRESWQQQIGLANRMEFIQSDSRKMQLPERVDVIVADIRGALPLFGHATATLEDARQRLLAPGGRLIPQRDMLKAAVIEAHDFYSKLVSPWSTSSVVANLVTLVAPSIERILQYTSSCIEQLLTEPQTWAVLDYSVWCESVHRPLI